MTSPLPTNLVPAGFATSNNWEVAPAATVKYLLFDFGGRTATVEEASQLSIAANAEFTTAHQKLIYNVADAYFMLDGAGDAMGETRKLAAILVADVVGYSRLAGADEDRTLARLRGLRSDLIDPAIAAHHGRIIKRTGDGSIIEFRSVVDAVRCALEVQTGMVERNAGLPPERRIEFRVGVHLGDVVEEADGDLMGDGVNVAARLEGSSRGICLSEDAYRQVKSRLELQVADLWAAKPQEHHRAGARLPAAPGRACGAKTAPSSAEDARRLGALACARRGACARASCGCGPLQMGKFLVGLYLRA